MTMGDDDPRSVANLDPRGMIGRIYVEYHLTLLHTKYTSFRPCGFREKGFKCFSHYKPTADNDASGVWPIWTSGSRLAGIIKGLNKHCFTQNIKALGLMVSEKKIFLRFFLIVSLWRPMTPEAWPTWTPGTWLAGFMKGTTKRCYILNI